MNSLREGLNLSITIIGAIFIGGLTHTIGKIFVLIYFMFYGILISLFNPSFTSFKNSPQWDFVLESHHLPGHACGLPALPTVNYLLDVFRQLMDVECSTPRKCRTFGCDPYTSVFKSKWFCYPKLRRPDLKNWQSDQAFVRQFLYVSNLALGV